MTDEISNMETIFSTFSRSENLILKQILNSTVQRLLLVGTTPYTEADTLSNGGPELGGPGGPERGQKALKESQG